VFFNGSTQVGLKVDTSPMVAGFSGLGPSINTPGIVKPDILAPRLNILGASHSSPANFYVTYGTSMVTPHISGVVALLKSVHPSWSPTAIRSSMMTTTDVFDHNGNRPILDKKHVAASVFATEAGHVNPTRAADPGLVYDIETNVSINRPTTEEAVLQGPRSTRPRKPNKAVTVPNWL
jgi:subtilisin family serine protease